MDGLLQPNEQHSTSIPLKLRFILAARRKSDVGRYDAVHVPSLNPTQLNSYVLQEEGLMFSSGGFNQRAYPIPWLYNQFKTEVLAAVLFVLERIELTPDYHNDPFYMTNVLNKFVRGSIIEGNWNSVQDTPEKFNGLEAEHALSWGGSAEILEKYHQYNGRKIGFAQCWVFTGVLITMLRALGIPSRPIINPESASDYESDFTIDYEYKNGKFDLRSQGNGVWNFHVWVQASMKRRDRGEKYYGWQEADPTYSIGAIPNQVLRDPEITGRDEAFFYAAVNADKASWFGAVVVEINTYEIGSHIITASLNLNYEEDLTSMYKPLEGTIDERRHYKEAADTFGIRPVSIYSRTTRSGKKLLLPPISLSIESLKPVFVGEPVHFEIHLKNPTFRNQKFNLILQIDSLFYSGHLAYPIMHNSRIISVASNSRE
ncbi:protein-glutamine gamma-glutamyltransferase 4-like protein [Dinothrombium tinctorium]|uniref:Protein-glutamine gamma-glutamyltransferase 4-like protein n=1 Tax=Dinothrombium tinctorium TaxID=1965070 RepID=A0A443QP49_9ACAR|nr:protein-glutamine gamma-glutamyltransferase 4-like protein [Dinothrombium tinctorium]